MSRPVLHLSYFFKRNRGEYYERLQAVRDSGDWEGWLTFFLRGVHEVSIEATETAASILRMRERFQTRIIDEFGRAAGNGLRVVERLFDHPIVAVGQIGK